MSTVNTGRAWLDQQAEVLYKMYGIAATEMTNDERDLFHAFAYWLATIQDDLKKDKHIILQRTEAE